MRRVLLQVLRLAAVPTTDLFRAAAQSLFLLLGFAIVAALCSFVRQPPTPRES